MSSTAETQILDEVGARLAGITQANGYFHDGGEIDRARQEPYKPHDLPRINYWHGANRRDDAGHGMEQRTLDLSVALYDKTWDRPFVDVADELHADGLIALFRSTSAPAVSDQISPALGGLVTTCYLADWTPAIGSGQKPWCGAFLTFRVQYNVRPMDPFTIIP